jgi:hypothetical protein
MTLPDFLLLSRVLRFSKDGAAVTGPLRMVALETLQGAPWMRRTTFSLQRHSLRVVLPRIRGRIPPRAPLSLSGCVEVLYV